MIDFPEWSDLGQAISPQTRQSWDFHQMECDRYRYYFEGDVLKEEVQTELPQDVETPLVFPAGLNLVKLMCLAQADACFGNYDELPVQFGVRQDAKISEADKAAIDLAGSVLESSNGGALLWEHELERNVYGGGAIAIKPDLKAYPHIRWSRVPKESFFPIWDPDDPDKLLEVFVRVVMTAEQARAKYGLDTHKEYVERVEHWTLEKYENTLDGRKLETYSGANPWGIVPFVYTPRYRMSSWWGEAITPDLIPVQDELNMRIGDIGDAINYNAHPVRWGVNMPRDFNAKNYPIGSNSFWNLGRVIGQSPPPQVGILEASAAVQSGVFEYLSFLYDWSRVSSFAPPIAFGEDDGGGQRSGVTLEIRMWPLIKAVRRSRTYLTGSLRQALMVSARILEQKRFSDVPVRAVGSLKEGSVLPHFNNILPRDQSAAVDEVVKLLATSPKSISLETAQSILGRGTGEVERIREMLQNEDLFEDPAEPDEPAQSPGITRPKAG
jgi:Phage portal protein, SPP1 Gp6-like